MLAYLACKHMVSSTVKTLQNLFYLHMSPNLDLLGKYESVCKYKKKYLTQLC
jgi:hypothetical protein